MPPIVYPLEIAVPVVSIFFVWNFACAAVCSAVLAILVLRKFWRLCRLNVLLAGAMNLTFQWPLALFSEPVVQSLSGAVYFSLCAHLTVAALLTWAAFTPGLDPSPRSAGELTPVQIAIPVATLFGLLGVFLLFMPFYCTALFAMLFDPSQTLLAREVTIKLAGSTLATSSFGGVANAAAPAVAGVAFVLLFRSIRKREVGLAALWLALAGACFGAVLIPGAKGLLISIGIVVVFAAVGSQRQWWLKLAAVGVSVVCMAGLLAGFEVTRERGGRVAPYDFAGCVVQLGAVAEGRELLQSMASGGLGMSARQIEELMASLASVSAGGQALPITIPDAVAPTAERASTYLGALFYRAFIVPFQGAAWHHLYVEEYGSPGIGTLPLALKILGYSTDATTLVYRAYGVTYSGGDATSTSTTPTSFVFAYSAYFGWVGLAAAILLAVALDTVAAFLLRKSGAAVVSIGGGLLAVISYTALDSDLYTVMASHGGAVAIFLIAALAKFQRMSA